jgi:hypothetical protein
MRREEPMMRSLIFFVMAAAMLLIGQGAGHAQATRTWVSGVGDDANPCSRTAPCKTFAGAISKTATNGEISVLDRGAYGAVTITKSISIVAEEGVAYGSVTNGGTSAVIVNGANIEVNLRGLHYEGGSSTTPGLTGIRILQAKTVNISNCTIRGNTMNVDAAGIRVIPASTAVEVAVNNCFIGKNSIGVIASPGAAGTVNLHLNNVSIVGNTFAGVSVAGGGSTTVSGSMITLNGTGLVRVGPATLISSGNNVVEANTADGTFSSTVALK